MTRRDDALLLDMLLACRKIQSFTHGLSSDEFENNALVQSAVIREFQVLGEAARMMSDAAKATHNQIPWPVIAGMRNRLIHEYFDIRVAIVWQTIQHDIPGLIQQLELIVPPEENEL